MTLLQYVDDLLIAAETEEDCLRGTKQLLIELSESGYRASPNKAQTCQCKVRYLGYLLEDRRCWLSEDKKGIILLIPAPKDPQTSARRAG